MSASIEPSDYWTTTLSGRKVVVLSVTRQLPAP
jgi:hypothetical protein